MSKLSEVSRSYDAAVVRLEVGDKLKNALRSKNSNFHAALGMRFSPEWYVILKHAAHQDFALETSFPL